MKKMYSFRMSATASAALDFLQRCFPDATATELIEAALQYAAYTGGLGGAGACPQISQPEQEVKPERTA